MASKRPGAHVATMRWPAPVRFYVISQYADRDSGELRWCLADSTGASVLPIEAFPDGRRPVGGFDPGAVLANGHPDLNSQQAAMESSAEERAAFAEAREARREAAHAAAAAAAEAEGQDPPPEHVPGHHLFLAVSQSELITDMGLGHLIGK